MKKALAIGLAAVMAVSMSAPVFAEDEGKGIARGPESRSDLYR